MPEKLALIHCISRRDRQGTERASKKSPTGKRSQRFKGMLRKPYQVRWMNLVTPISNSTKSASMKKCFREKQGTEWPTVIWKWWSTTAPPQHGSIRKIIRQKLWGNNAGKLQPNAPVGAVPSQITSLSVFLSSIVEFKCFYFVTLIYMLIGNMFISHEVTDVIDSNNVYIF